jgi:hypothetical protein
MARKLMILSLTVLMALPNLVFASGGNNPPLERAEKITGPTFSVTVVMDATKANLPAGTRWASLRIKKGSLVSGVVFTVPIDFYFFKYGCSFVNTEPEKAGQFPAYSNLTEVRFLYTPLIEWMPGDKLMKLFRVVGIEIDENTGYVAGLPYAMTPMITSVENEVCAPNDAATGTLSFDAVIQFKIPQR